MVQLDMFFEDISPIEASLVRVCCCFVTCNSSRERRELNCFKECFVVNFDLSYAVTELNLGVECDCGTFGMLN